MTGDRARQRAAVGLSIVGLTCAGWLLLQAARELTSGVRLPAGGAK